MFGFFRHTASKKQNTPPATLPQNHFVPLSVTEMYKRQQFTPMVEAQNLGGLPIASTAQLFNERSSGTITFANDPQSGMRQTVLVLDGVAR